MRYWVSILPLLLLTLLSPASADSLLSADGYRLPPYRAPAPRQLAGATVLDTQALRKQIAAEPETVLVDVYNLNFDGRIFLQARPHPSLPGAVWLPNVGTEPLKPLWRDYLRDHLHRLTNADPRHPLIFFCRSDCWLSWNAARRAVALGYQSVYWYRNGVDGWLAAGGSTTGLRPEPLIPAP